MKSQTSEHIEKYNENELFQVEVCPFFISFYYLKALRWKIGSKSTKQRIALTVHFVQLFSSLQQKSPTMKWCRDITQQTNILTKDLLNYFLYDGKKFMTRQLYESA